MVVRAGARERTGVGVKRRLERLVLGWVMAAAAYLLDRRLRRVRRDEPGVLPAAEVEDEPAGEHGAG